MITITQNTALTEMSALLSRLQDKRSFLTRTGVYVQDEVQERIMNRKRSPENAPWSPWSARRRRERLANGNAHLGLLWDTGALLNSIQPLIGAASIEVGTSVPYASELQFGRSDMPARPFVGWSLEIESTIARDAELLFYGPMINAR